MLKHFGLNRNLTVLCTTIIVNIFVMFTWNSLLPLHLRALGANDWELGISFTLIGMARTAFSIFGGALADRYGRRVMLAIPPFAISPLYVLAGITNNWAALVALLIATNAITALQGPAFNALITESAEDQRIARAYSLTEFSIIVGLIGGPVAGAALLSTFNIPTLIILNAITLLLTGTLRAWGLRESAHHTRGDAVPNVRTAIDSKVRWFIVTNSLIAMAFGICFGPFFAILARDAWHNSEAEINLLFAAGNVASLVGLTLGRMSDRWGARRVLVLGGSVFAVSVMAWGIAPTWQWGLVPLLIAFAFSEGAFIALQTMQAEITSPETRSSVLGIIATTSGFIGGLGPTLAAWLIPLGGNPMPFIATGAMGLLAIAAATPIRKQQVVASTERTRRRAAE